MSAFQADFEGEFWAEQGNVRAIMSFDGLDIRFTAAPPKMRELAAAIVRACDEADAEMPK